MAKRISYEHPLEKSGYVGSYRRIVMYEDLNAAGTMFGGSLVSWIDEAAAIYASCQMNFRRIVTKKISELVFRQPARLGDVLEVWCNVTKAGTTSLTIQAIVTRKVFPDVDDTQKKQKDNLQDNEICRCDLVFIAVDKSGRPIPWAI